MKKDDTQFRADILKILKDQDAKIEELALFVRKQSEHVDSVLHSVLEKTSAPVEAPEIEACAVYTTFDSALGLLEKEEMQKRSGEVAKKIKPIMKEFGLSGLQALLTKKK